MTSLDVSELCLTHCIGADRKEYLTVDASALGLAPGDWPASVQVGDEVFRYSHSVFVGDDLGYREYRSESRRLDVFND